MNILHLSKFYPPDYYGGIETVCKDLCEGLIINNVETSVICHAHVHKEINKLVNGVNVYFCPINFSFFSFHFSVSYILRFYKLVKTVDIVHIHCPNPLAFLSVLFSPFSFKYVLHWHSDVIKQKFLYKFFKFIENIVVNNAEIIIGSTNSHIVSSHQYQNFKNKYKVIPYALNFDFLNAKPKKPNSIPTYFFNKKFVFSLGRHVSYKGFNLLIESALDTKDDFNFIIGGDGPDFSKNENLIQKYNLSNRIFLTGKLSLNEIIYLYKNCKVFCLPSITKAEMFGVVQLEAMYFNKPVISCNIPGSGVPIVNLHNITGLTIKPNCTKSLSNAFNYIFSDDNYLRYSSNIKKHLKNYVYQKCLNSHISLYKKVLS